MSRPLSFPLGNVSSWYSQSLSGNLGGPLCSVSFVLTRREGPPSSYAPQGREQIKTGVKYPKFKLSRLSGLTVMILSIDGAPTILPSSGMGLTASPPDARFARAAMGWCAGSWYPAPASEVLCGSRHFVLLMLTFRKPNDDFSSTPSRRTRSRACL